jgi:hypothetical protein
MRTKEKRRKNCVITGEFARQTKKKRVAAAIGLAVILGMTGCAETVQEKSGNADISATQEGEWAREEQVPAQGKEYEEPQKK